MPWWRRWFGTRSERSAERYLKGLGWRILARNHQSKLGEIDLIGLEGDCIVFVEVRSTGGEDLASRAESVNPAKQARLTRAALGYLTEKNSLDQAARFDVLAISWPAHEPNPTIEHFRNAFDVVGRFQMHT
jgi:putative endonuclease